MKTKQQELSWNSSEIKNFMFWIMIIVVIGLCIYLIFIVRNESMKCMSSPLVYGAGHLTSSGNISIQCSCYSQGSDQVIYFDKNNITISTKGYLP